MDNDTPTDQLGELETTQAMPGIIEALEVQALELDQEIEEAEAEARNALADDSNLTAIRFDIPQMVRAEFLLHAATVREAERKLKSGEIGSKEFDRVESEAGETLDKRVLRGRGYTHDNIDTLRSRYGAQQLRPMTADVQGEVTLGHVAFDNKSAKLVFREAEECLRLSQKGDQRQLGLLDKLHHPLVERMATQPPRYARAWQPAFEKLLPLIEKRLDLAKHGPRDRLTQRVAEEAVWAFDSGVSTAKANGWEDVLIATAAPSLNWKGE